MAGTAGRGRGRGRGGPTPNTAAQVKPGGGLAREPMDQLEILVKSLSLDADDKELLPVRETATKASTSQEKMNEVFMTLYQRCHEDWRFSPCAAKICQELIKEGLEVGDTTFRTIMINDIRADVQNKDKIRSEAPQKFLGTASLLCQVYARMLNDKGEPFVPLNNSVMDCLSMMLDDKATDEEMLCGAEQLYAVGKTLHQCVDKIKLTELRNKVKDKIIYAVGSKDIRIELIKVVEGFASEWRHYS